MQQSDLFLSGTIEPPGRDLLALAAHPSAVLVLPCGRRKANGPAAARDLYVSRRFRALRRLAEDIGATYVIASAKHGIVSPDTILAPYDEDLALWPLEAQLNWGERVLDQLSAQDSRPILLLTETYAAAVTQANALRSIPLALHAPLLNQRPSEAEEWVQQALALATRVSDLRTLYSHIAEARKRGQTFLLGELAERTLPERGVYIFLDASEQSAWSRGPRIVRVGTHGVSLGSKSSLRNRLRNHLGPSHGIGSHRGSIFRLHVGRAMLEAGGRNEPEVPSWGVGQQAPKPVPDLEIALERRVTDYLRQLEVFVFAIDDPASKTSLRAVAETQLIGLMTAGGVGLEAMSDRWLGNHSPVASIRQTGLWNVRDVGAPYRPARRGSVSDLLKLKPHA